MAPQRWHQGQRGQRHHGTTASPWKGGDDRSIYDVSNIDLDIGGYVPKVVHKHHLVLSPAARTNNEPQWTKGQSSERQLTRARVPEPTTLPRVQFHVFKNDRRSTIWWNHTWTMTLPRLQEWQGTAKYSGAISTRYITRESAKHQSQESRSHWLRGPSENIILAGRAQGNTYTWQASAIRQKGHVTRKIPGSSIKEGLKPVEVQLGRWWHEQIVRIDGWKYTHD